MPENNEEQYKFFLDLLENAIPLTLNASQYSQKEAEKACDEYLKNPNKNVHELYPLSIYYIISKLPEEKQIKFIKENIEYIKEHDEDIFLYTMYVPESLSYFLSLKVLKEIYNLDKNLFKKIISTNNENLIHGFTQEDYIEFYSTYINELKELENHELINVLELHNRFCYTDITSKNINDIHKLQAKYNKEFITFILENYKQKIDTFTEKELLRFIQNIDDITIYKSFINDNYEKLNKAFNHISEIELTTYLSDTVTKKQEILIELFFDSIIIKQDITKIIYKLEPSIIIKLYNQNKEVFNKMTLKDWLKVCSRPGTFHEELKENFKNILDTFNIDNIESLFDTKFYVNAWYREDISALKYIEIKYRSNIKITRYIEDIDNSTSIFSEKYIKNLKELNILLKNKSIDKNSDIYKKHLSLLILYLKEHNIISNLEGNNLKEIEKLFQRLVSGLSLTVLYQVSSIKSITLLNRLGKLDFDVEEFTVEQLENYNVKQHKLLYKDFDSNSAYLKDYKKLTLKLMFLVGYNHTKKILELDSTIPTLEHLVGNINVKNITLDNQGNPILNNKIINLIFNDKNYTRIIEMLKNKDNDLYKYFPRIFNEWEMIKLNDKEKSLSTIIDFLKSDDISLPPKYYRLEGLFKYIGCENSIVNETLNLHNQMLERVYSTIPRITGTKDEYTYEVLKLDDMNSLTIGSITDCCFTVLGNGYQCLKHAVTSKNGRILIIRKNNEILAHSWLWRNGDLLCLDNIEISKKINEVNFLDIYLQFADEIIKKSYEEEGINTCIKNITIGFTNFDKPIIGIEQYPCIISRTCNLLEKNFGTRIGPNRKFLDPIPQPLEAINYSDSKNVQYIIRGNGNFKLGEVYHYYQDERHPIINYNQEEEYESKYLNHMTKMINGLRYIKYELENNLDSYKTIDIDELQESICSNDWYIITLKDGTTESFTSSFDERVKTEIPTKEKSKIKKHSK